MNARQMSPWKSLGMAIFVASLTFAIFSSSMSYDFVNLDDGDYVYGNAIVRSGLSWHAIERVFTQPHAAMYAPVLWVSYMLDVELFGLSSATGFHFTNVLLHSLNAGLFFFLLLLWSRKPWRAFFFSALWALHPLRIESVAWVAERKDVLSGFFFLLCLLFYGMAFSAKETQPASSLEPTVTRPRWGFYFAALLSFALGLLVKPSLVPLPALLLLLDFWPLRRIESIAFKPLLRDGPRLLLEKVPFFALSIIASMVSTMAHRSFAAIHSADLGMTLKAVPLNVVFYLSKFILPRWLSVLYPNLFYVRTDFLIAVFLLGAVSLCAWSLRKRTPAGLVGWLWFLGLFVPVIGIVRFGSQSVADRFVYLPSMGISVALLFVWPSATIQRRAFAVCRTMGAICVLALLVFLTHRALPIWKNTTSLFQNVIRHFPDNTVALTQLADDFMDNDGDFVSAESLADRAMLLSSPSITLLSVKATCLLNQSEQPSAAYEFLLKHHPPSNAETAPGTAEWTLTWVSLCAKQYDDTIRHAEDALRIMPVFNYTRNAVFLLAMAAAFEKGDSALTLHYANQFPPYRDKTEVTMEDLMPAYLTLWDSSARRPVVDYFRRVVQKYPKRPDILNNIAWGLAVAHWSPMPPDEVLAIARLAHAQQPEHPVLMDTLAAAQAHSGDFDGACKTLQDAIASLTGSTIPENIEFRAKLQTRLLQYQRKEPLREDAFKRLWGTMMP